MATGGINTTLSSYNNNSLTSQELRLLTPSNIQPALSRHSLFEDDPNKNPQLEHRKLSVTTKGFYKTKIEYFKFDCQ